jgi:phosphate uptake regulator
MAGDAPHRPPAVPSSGSSTAWRAWWPSWGRSRRVAAAGLLAFAGEDLDTCEAVIAGDDAVDERFEAVEREALLLIARQAPVVSDARLLTGAMHIGLHLERIGDLGVNVAELTKLAAGLPRDPVVLQDLREMGATAAAPACGTVRCG